MTASSLVAPPVLGAKALAFALLFMAACVFAAIAFKPHKYWADAIGDPNYDKIIPVKFGDWQEVTTPGNQIVDPVQEAAIQHIYTNTLARTYVYKPNGREIMLSIAYGRNQNLDTQVHLPEMCYGAQGYKISKLTSHLIHTRYGDLKGKELATSFGYYDEPVTYFIRVGQRVALTSLDRNLARIQMALRGYLIDGMLFRVSEATSNAADSYKLQDKFINDLLNAVSPADREKIIGREQ